MDHTEVVRQGNMTERYLLNELDPHLREEFEEHFFECPECAMDVRAGDLLIEQTRAIVAEREGPAPARFQERTAEIEIVRPIVDNKPGWMDSIFGWMRPAIAVPVMAALLVVIGYQNLVTYPHLEQAANRPQVLPWASVNIGTYGEGQTITTKSGQSFLLFVRIPPEKAYASYTAELYNPARKLEWTLAIPVTSAQQSGEASASISDRWPVQVPGANWVSGTYTLTVRGTTAAGETKEVGTASFELQVAK
jgi:hypothetical protein